ncbi:MAG: hypothetical protein QM730_12045 [Anaerolineales bacterium]
MLRKIHPVLTVWLLGLVGLGAAIVGFVNEKPDNFGFNILSSISLGFLIGYLVVRLESQSISTGGNKNDLIRDIRLIFLFFLMVAAAAKDDLKSYMFFAVSIYLIIIAVALTYWIRSKELTLTWKEFFGK